jgi:hypothetical protein
LSILSSKINHVNSSRKKCNTEKLAW